MNGDSTVYTVGTALQRARDAGRSVEVLVEGSWIGGQVVAADAYGVVLDLGGIEHTVVRVERVSAVRVLDVSGGSGVRPLPAEAV